MAEQTVLRVGPLICPVLLGRDELLQHASRRLATSSSGAGQLLFLAGEAGIGKTRLLGAVERSGRERGFRVARGFTFSRDLAVPGAPFLDLARGMRRDNALARTGEWLHSRLTEPVGHAGDAHRRRRLLILDAAEALLSAADRKPLLISLEDLHWADDLSLEILAALARRIPEVPLLVVATYRSDELYPRIPMREWRARLITARMAEEAQLERLSVADTAAMIRLLLAGEGEPASDFVTAVYERTDGIPLHVEELLGAIGSAGADRSRVVHGVDVPDTLQAAVLERLDRLSAGSRRVARAAAVIGRSFALRLLTDVVRQPQRNVERALDELGAHFFVLPAEAGRFDFRHALIRDAIYGSLNGSERRTLHARVADAAAGSQELNQADLSRHFEEAGRRQEAFSHALAAARSARRFSAHREALVLYRRALGNVPDELAHGERTELLREAGIEAAAADDNEQAAQMLQEARDGLREAGRAVEAAALLEPLVAARHLLGDPLQTRVGMLQAGLAELAEQVGSEADKARAKLESALSAAYMLDRRVEESLEHGRRALQLVNELGDRQTELDAMVTVGADLLIAGRLAEGYATFEQAIEQSRSARFEAQAARAYRMVGSAASVLVEYEEGERRLREGIEYAERVEMWNHRHYMASHLAHVLWATGSWAEADAVAAHALADGRGGITTKITALHVLGYLALGRAEQARAFSLLDEARDMGEQMRELQRLSPALWGLAELALQQGHPDRARDLCDQGLAASLPLDDAMYLFPFLVTGTRARLALRDVAGAERWVRQVAAQLRRRSIPGTLLAIDHAEGLVMLASGATGRARRALNTAAEGWAQRRRAWEGTWAKLDLAACQLRSNKPADAARLAEQALAAAQAMGSPVLEEAADVTLRPARARHPSEDPWAPLSTREFEIARLVSRGATNGAIAAELGISPKTVSSHVEHILDKLGVSRRSEIAAWAARVAGEGEHP